MATAQIVALSAQKRTRIINRYLELTQQLAKVKTELEMLKVEAIELMGEGQHETRSARVSINWIERSTFDGAKARSFLTAAQAAECMKKSAFFDVRAKAL